MEETLSQGDLKRRGFVSTISLFFQSGYSAVLGLVANLILTILLSPLVFGLYITVLSIISILNYFSDIGLAASLIQKKELDREDVKTTFTIQQILILAIIATAYASTSFVKSFYSLPPQGVYLYWALLLAFFISSLKTIPSIFLERKIQFQKIVYVQIVENTVFYIAVSALALMGYGLMSFVIAVLLRSAVGLILIYSLSPWMPRIGISFSHLKHLLTFGIPFQASSFLALFKDDLIILYLGRAIGFEALGYIGWAKKWADTPLRIIMDNVSRVLFPLLARVQEDKEKIKKVSERLLYYQTAILAPTIIGMIFTMQQFVDIIPNYEKWAPALPLFYIFAISSLVVSFFAPFINLFNALGRVKTSFYFMIFFTALMWALTPVMTKAFGIFGFPFAHLIVSCSFVFVLFSAKRHFHFHFFAPIYRFMLSALLMGAFLLAGSVFVTGASAIWIFLKVSAGMAIYYLALHFFFGFRAKKELAALAQKKE